MVRRPVHFLSAKTVKIHSNPPMSDDSDTEAPSNSQSDRSRLGTERQKAKILVVCPNSVTGTQLRQALKSIGFVNVSAAPSHVQALERIKGRPFTHVIFDAKASDMPALEFVEAVLNVEETASLIAISEQPRVDDVFGLLRAGSRGFLVPPFNTETIESVVLRATEGPALSEAVLNAPDRNSAFIAVVLNNLYKLSVSMRQAREFPTAAREVVSYGFALRESMEMANLFAEGSEEDVRDKIIEACINRAKDAATRLGRLRKKLKRERGIDDGPAEKDEAEAASPEQKAV